MKSCWCQKQMNEIYCSKISFECGQICNRKLECGKHYCQDKCHSGACKKCSLIDIETCPCGKKEIYALRNNCLDPIPLCNQVCDKHLECQIHRCKLKCHLGSCESCKNQVEIFCKCGSVKKKIQCTKRQDFNCEIPCKLLKSCKKHKCNQVCCEGKLNQNDGGLHLCYLPCEKPLDCGKHNCEKFCHIGNCPPCEVIYNAPVFCPCGKTFNKPPVRCGTNEMLVKCRNPCNKELECGHICKALCHEGQHPICVELVNRNCNCGELIRPNVACHIKNVVCGKRCQKLLSCGEHKCGIVCHTGVCQQEEKKEGESCGKICGRKLECGHQCQAKCHSGQECPKVECEAEVRLTCQCGVIGRVFSCSQKQIIECNKECERVSRNKKLDKALGTNREEKIEYSEEFIKFGQQNAKFLEQLETRMFQMIQKAEQLVSLPKMNLDKRTFVHEYLTCYYKVDTISYDSGPNRSIVVYGTQEMGIPEFTLSQYVKQVQQGLTKAKEAKPVVQSILFYDLSQNETTLEVNNTLSKWAGEFDIEWVNDHSCKVNFYEENLCKEAAEKCQKVPGPFSVLKIVDKEGKTLEKKVRQKKWKPQEF